MPTANTQPARRLKMAGSWRMLVLSLGRQLEKHPPKFEKPFDDLSEMNKTSAVRSRLTCDADFRFGGRKPIAQNLTDGERKPAKPCKSGLAGFSFGGACESEPGSCRVISASRSLTALTVEPRGAVVERSPVRERENPLPSMPYARRQTFSLSSSFLRDSWGIAVSHAVLLPAHAFLGGSSLSSHSSSLFYVSL